MTDMLEVVIDSVRVSLMSPHRVVLLREKEGERYLPIWVGPYEAEAITVALQEVEMIRPLTHDLLKNIFGLFEARLLRVEITSLRDDIFYGEIVAEQEGRLIRIDARPSDAIALAVRARVPILAARSVLQVAGIRPDDDIAAASDSPSDAPPSPPPAPDESDRRLSVFKDFLDRLDEGKSSDAPSEPPSPEGPGPA